MGANTPLIPRERATAAAITARAKSDGRSRDMRFLGVGLARLSYLPRETAATYGESCFLVNSVNAGRGQAGMREGYRGRCKESA
jgi:hypothetical protein